MKIARPLIASLLLMYASTSMAAIQVTGRITQLWVNDTTRSNVVWIQTNGSFTASCAQTSGFIILDLSLPGMKELYAMALSAFHTGSNVTVGTDGCRDGYELLKFMYMTG